MPEEPNLDRKNWTYLSPAQRCQLLRQEGYYDLEYRGHVYKYMSPKVDPEKFKKNLDHLVGHNDSQDSKGTVDAPREGCATVLRIPSLSKVKQLNRKFPYRREFSQEGGNV